MKRFLFITFILYVAFVQSTFAQVDYYSACDTIKGDCITYKVTHYDFGIIFLENENNTESHKPIIWSDTGEMASIAERWPLAIEDEKQAQRLVREVFSRREIRKFRKSKNMVNIGVIVDAQMGKSIEVGYSLSNREEYGDPIMFSIPVNKFETLEQLIKEQLLWEVPSWAGAASHIERSIRLF